MGLEDDSGSGQIETARILVNDFMERLDKSDVVIDPEILSAVLMRQAGTLLLKKYGSSLEDYQTAVHKNFKRVHDLFFKHRG